MTSGQVQTHEWPIGGSKALPEPSAHGHRFVARQAHSPNAMRRVSSASSSSKSPRPIRRVSDILKDEVDVGPAVTIVVLSLANAFAAPSDAAALQEAADRAMVSGDLAEAERLAREVLDLFREDPNQTRELAGSQVLLANILIETGDFEGAISLYRSSLDILDHGENGHAPERQGALNGLALVYQRLGRLTSARPLLEEALELIERQHGQEHNEYATVLTNLASLHHGLRNTDLARRLFEQSLDIQRRLPDPDPIGIAHVQHNLALLLHEEGDPIAESHVRESLAIHQTVYGADHPVTAHGLDLLGIIYHSRGDYSAARIHMERALAIREASLGPDHPDVAGSLVDLASVLDYLGERDQVVRSYERAISIQTSALGVEHYSVAVTRNNLGDFHRRQGDFGVARFQLDESLRIRRKRARSTSDPRVATALNALAHLHKDEGDLVEAQRLYEQSLALRRVAHGDKHTRVATAANNLAIVLVQRREYVKAESLLMESLAIRREKLGDQHEKVANTLASLAQIAQHNGEFARAHSLFDDAIDTMSSAVGADSPQVAVQLNNKAVLLKRQGEYEGALRLYEKSLTLSLTAFGPTHPYVTTTRRNMAYLMLRSDDLAAARETYAELLAIREARFELMDSMSDREALAYVADSRIFLDKWLAAFSEPGDEELAWSTILRWKGLGTHRTRKRTELAALNPGSRAQLEELNEVRRRLARLLFAEFDADTAEHRRATLEKLTERKEALARALPNEQREQLRTLDRPRATEVCAALADGTALVDYLRTGSEYLAFVAVAPGCGIHRVELGRAQDVDDRILEWRRALGDGQTLTWRIDRRGEEVRALIWDPLRDLLADANRLIVSPDGPISALPFAALPMGGRYLIEDMPVTYVERAQEVLAPPNDGVGAGVLAVGGVDFDGIGDSISNPTRHQPGSGTRGAACVDDDFDPLPGTRRELSVIADTWARSRYRREPTTDLGDGHATEQAVAQAMAGKRLIHLGTHGFFATGRCRSALTGGGETSGAQVTGYNPLLLSGVVLAGVNAPRTGLQPYDGILTAEEIGTLDLRGVQLVVLSACNTGLGEVQSGEGVLGLRSAFAAAGAESVVMSLWAVPDKATSAVMTSFYDLLLHRRRPVVPADALRQAQLALLEENRESTGHGHPGSWAGFVVVQHGW